MLFSLVNVYYFTLSKLKSNCVWTNWNNFGPLCLTNMALTALIPQPWWTSLRIGTRILQPVCQSRLVMPSTWVAASLHQLKTVERAMLGELLEERMHHQDNFHGWPIWVTGAGVNSATNAVEPSSERGKLIPYFSSVVSWW